MSRIESGRILFKDEPERLLDVIEAMEAMVVEEAKRKNLQLILQHEGLEDEYVLCDRLRLSQVMLNIVSNAVKYTPEGGSVTLVSRRLEGNLYEFSSRDTGIGMSPEFLKTIFEPFSREETATVSGIQGTGLGMSIVKRLVEMASGTIDVQSEKGKGTTVTVRVPFKRVPKPETPEGKKTASALPALEGKRVLLVEDNELNREIAAELLGELGLVVTTAEDGEKALSRIVAGECYDIILTDVQMPRMTGYEFARQVRAWEKSNGGHNVIIACTANAFEEDRRTAFEAGMDGHIAKPIRTEEIVEQMARGLEIQGNGLR